MLVADEFEGVLRAGAAVPFGSAAADDTSAREAIEQALRRLEQQPDVRCLAPDGAETYNDPVLAVAFAWAMAASEAVGIAAAPTGSDLRTASLFKWALVGVKMWLNRGAAAFNDLAARIPSQALCINKETVRIAVVGDAGYRGVPQDNVLFMIKAAHQRESFDLLIHLGDTYFAGSEAEIVRHLLAPFGEVDVRLVALCGNHDLYHGPAGYTAALKSIKQLGRFLMIETPHWRIAGLDTALGSAGQFGDDGSLDDVQLQWLDGHLLSESPKKLVLMSHHFIVSGWEPPAKTLLMQLKERVRGRVFAWYWGHEHRCVTYDPDDGGFYGACIGNGAFLEKWSAPRRDCTAPTWYASHRCSCIKPKGSDYWPHGFLELELGPHGIKEIYHLEGGHTYKRELPCHLSS
jgi:hypothetical protein